MKTLLISAAVAVSAIAAAAPAAAQYYPAPSAYDYGYQRQYQQQQYQQQQYQQQQYQQQQYQQQQQQYQQHYGQQNGYAYQQRGLVRSYLVRVDNLRNRILKLDARDRISDREADGLKREASYIRNMVRAAGYNGLGPRERREIEVRLARLEQRIRYERRDGNNYRGQGYGQNQYGQQVFDRDRDGRDDRYEDDRGTRRD